MHTEAGQEYRHEVSRLGDETGTEDGSDEQVKPRKVVGQQRVKRGSGRREEGCEEVKEGSEGEEKGDRADER